MPLVQMIVIGAGETWQRQVGHDGLAQCRQCTSGLAPILSNNNRSEKGSPAMVGTPDHRTRITTLCMSVLWLDNHSVLVLDVRGIKSPISHRISRLSGTLGTGFRYT